MNDETRSFVTAQQVAERAGVSRSAVSRTFTVGGRVSQSTREKVLKAADALGYHVNHLARGLIQERSDIVCLIAAGIATPFQSAILEAVTRRLQETRKVAMLINTSGQSDSVESALRQTLNYRADATVVMSGTPAESLVDTCLARGQRVVLINRADRSEGLDLVQVDNGAAARQAFLALRRAGCRRIVVVSSNAGTPSLVAREEAFSAMADGAGLDVTIGRFGPTSYATGAETARRLFSAGDRPDAAFCVTDLLACGFMDVARHEFAIRIPDELCVIGFDDIEQAGWASYQLTTFRQPVEDMAEHIVGLIVNSSTSTVRGGTAVFEAAPVWRKTVRPR